MPSKKNKIIKLPEEQVLSEQEFDEQKSKGKGNVFIGTLNVAMRPAQALTGHVSKAYKTRYEGRYKKAKLFFYIDIVLLGVIAALAITVVFLYFYKPSVADKIRVEEVILPSEAVSGQELSFIWTYKNESEVILDEMYWSFNVPENFEILSTAPARSDAEKNVISLGALPPGAGGRIKMYGRVWGTIGDAQTIWSTLGFVQAENRKNEQKAVATSYTISDSVLDASLSAPEKLVNNQEVEIKFNCANAGDQALQGIELHPYWPAGFEYISSDVERSGDIWELGALEPGESLEMEIEGFLSSPEGKASFYFETYVQIEGQDVRQEILGSISEVLPPQLEVTTIINDSATPALAWGGEAKIGVNYTNISDYELEDLSFAIEVDPYLINTARVSGLEYADGKFYIQADVDSLSPGDSGQVLASVYLKSSPDWSYFSEVSEISVPLAVQVSYNIQGEEQEVVYKTGRTSVKMQSQFYIKTFARYWAQEGDQLGRGPIPPRVDRATKYWVFANLGQTTNKLSNIYLQIKLPANVTYAGLSSVTLGDKISYDADNHLVTWFLKNLEPTMVSGGPTVAVSFEVEVVPTAAQVGAPASLVDWVKMSAFDEFVAQDIGYTAGAISTDLTYDSKASGLGDVRY
ncbi:hypothetical protein KJ969_00845 [Patescibacteria group bacterium]|nr:hypothetical protein [Patescibacteria group bacterium]MBU1921842.1 hypothetical protein [Patescibacteria group bacterium]